MITVTDSAVHHLRGMLEERGEVGDPSAGLRIFIERGGCSGLQYGMRFAPREPGDEAVERDGVRVFIDAGSAEHLRGSTIDFHDGLTGTGFRIENPNAVRTCGCGTSFEPAAAEPATTAAVRR